MVSSATPNKHTVPTHLNLPDQVLTVWSFGLTARQLLLILVGGGLSGDMWQSLHLFSSLALPGQLLRGGLALLPLVVACFVAWYRSHGRYLEGWALVLARYRLRPHRYVWRSIRACSAPSHHARLQHAEETVIVTRGSTRFTEPSLAALHLSAKREQGTLPQAQQRRLHGEVV